MKTKIFNLKLLLSLLMILFFIFSSCNDNNDDANSSLPNELLGSWSKSFGGSDGCTQTYTFRSNDYTFFESCYYTGSDSYDDKVAEVFEDEKMFRTPDKMYIAWHVEGTKLFLYKNNPGDPKPVLGDNWWSTYSPYYKK